MAYKIVYFVDSAQFGGSEQALLHLLSELDRQRWQPVLFHHPEPSLAPLLDGAQRLGVRTQKVPRVRQQETITGLPQFIYHLRHEQPDIFHAHLNWLLSCKFALLGAAFLRTPAIFATLQQFWVGPRSRSIRWQQGLLTRVVHRYVAVSQAVAGQLYQDFGVPSEKVRVVPNCIPLTAFDCPPDPALRQALTGGRPRKIVLTVARLDAQKGLTYLLDAARQVPEAVFVLAGSGGEQAALEAQAQSLGIQDRVAFLGYRQDVPALLASCDLFVLPSRYEGLPLSVLEAMAAGKPVVATDVGGTREALVDGETGLLAPPADPPALAAAIRSLLSDPARAAQMGAAGRRRVQREFSVAAMAQAVMRLYEEVLGTRRRAG